MKIKKFPKINNNNLFKKIFKSHKDIFEIIFEFLDLTEVYLIKDVIGEDIILPMIKKRVPKEFDHIPYASYRFWELGLCCLCFMRTDVFYNFLTIENESVCVCRYCDINKTKMKFSISDNKPIVKNNSYDMEMIFYNSVFLNKARPTIEKMFPQIKFNKTHEMKKIKIAINLKHKVDMFLKKFKNDTFVLQLGGYYINVLGCLDNRKNKFYDITTSKSICIFHFDKVIEILHYLFLEKNLLELIRDINTVKKKIKDFNENIGMIYKKKICNVKKPYKNKPRWKKLHRDYVNEKLNFPLTTYEFYAINILEKLALLNFNDLVDEFINYYHSK